jgi:twitching motility protein PilT
MMLFRQGLITYEEALRQSSNPDDFALRVSGISATSDSSWDGFEKPDEHAAPTQPGNPKLARPAVPPGSAIPTPTATPAAALPPPGSRSPTPIPTPRPTIPPVARPVTSGPPPAPDDDFQLERF